MNNDLARWLVGALWLVFLIALSRELGFQKAILITFLLIVLLPREIFGFLLGLIIVSVNLTLMELMFKYWPITLIVSIVALLSYLTEKDSETKPQEESSCKRLS